MKPGRWRGGAVSALSAWFQGNLYYTADSELIKSLVLRVLALGIYKCVESGNHVTYVESAFRSPCFAFCIYCRQCLLLMQQWNNVRLPPPWAHFVPGTSYVLYGNTSAVWSGIRLYDNTLQPIYIKTYVYHVYHVNLKYIVNQFLRALLLLIMWQAGEPRVHHAFVAVLSGGNYCISQTLRTTRYSSLHLA